MSKNLSLLSSLLLAFCWSCMGGGGGCPWGMEGCACREDLSCDAGLACGSDNVCAGTSSGTGGAQSGTGGGSQGGDTCDPFAEDEEVCPAMEACINTYCQAELHACFGAGYEQRNFSGGACEQEILCEIECDCDASCSETCPETQACEDCIWEYVDCALDSCLDEALACAN